MYKIPDRILKNHNGIVRRFDIDNFLRENYNSNLFSDNILNICKKIGTIDIDNNKKFIISLENISHSLDINNINYNQDVLIETVTEYFLYNGLYDTLDNMENILENVSFKNKANLSKIKDLLAKFPKDEIKSKADIKNVIRKFYSLSKNNIIEETPNMFTWIRKGIIYSTLGVNLYLGALTIFIDYFIGMNIKRSETKKMISKMESEKKLIEKKLNSVKDSKKEEEIEKYLKEIDSNLNKLEVYEETLYSERELEERDDEKMNFESTDIMNNIVSFTKEEYFNLHHNNFINEIFKAKNELTRLANSIFSKYTKDQLLLITSREELEDFESVHEDRLEEYMDTDNRLSYCIGQFLPYNSESYIQDEKHIIKTRDLLFTLTEEVSKVVDEDIIIYFDGNDDIYNIFVSLGIPISDSIQENTMNIELKKNLSVLFALEEQVVELSKKDTSSIFKNMREEFMDICEDDIEYLCAFNTKHNHIFDQDILKESLLELKNKIYTQESNKKYVIGSAIQESVYQLSKPRKDNILVSKNRYQVLAEAIDINNGLEILQELSVGNSLKLAQQKLVSNTKKLSDKEKAVSRQMDNALEKMYMSVEKELTNKNREKVIKGSAIPSASNIVKLAIATPVAFMINPALAAITVLGGLAVSKKGTQKEKQYILDEINIMLKMTDKKIQLAENNNDMDAIEQLLRTKQKLERERQRIKYNMRARVAPVTNE